MRKQNDKHSSSIAGGGYTATTLVFLPTRQHSVGVTTTTACLVELWPLVVLFPLFRARTNKLENSSATSPQRHRTSSGI